MPQKGKILWKLNFAKGENFSNILQEIT